jgi:hypothetical protein
LPQWFVLYDHASVMGHTATQRGRHRNAAPDVKTQPLRTPSSDVRPILMRLGDVCCHSLSFQLDLTSEKYRAFQFIKSIVDNDAARL